MDEIIKFCSDYGVQIDKSMKNKIDNLFNEPAFIENLINVIIRRSIKDRNEGKAQDFERVRELLIELEKVRLGLEFMQVNTSNKQNTESRKIKSYRKY